MNRYDRKLIASYYETWESLRDHIKELYSDRNPQSVTLMHTVIDNYKELLKYGGQEINTNNGNQVPILLPLNGEERLQFVIDKINSHYAYIQLDALYAETKKKAARLSVTEH